MPLDVFPNRRLCERVATQPLPLAVRRNLLELLVREDRDDPVHENPVTIRG